MAADKPRLKIVLLGAPGVGKSTFINAALKSRNGVPRPALCAQGEYYYMTEVVIDGVAIVVQLCSVRDTKSSHEVDPWSDDTMPGQLLRGGHAYVLMFDLSVSPNARSGWENVLTQGSEYVDANTPIFIIGNKSESCYEIKGVSAARLHFSVGRSRVDEYYTVSSLSEDTAKSTFRDIVRRTMQRRLSSAKSIDRPPTPTLTPVPTPVIKKSPAVPKTHSGTDSRPATNTVGTGSPPGKRPPIPLGKPNAVAPTTQKTEELKMVHMRDQLAAAQAKLLSDQENAAKRIASLEEALRKANNDASIRVRQAEARVAEVTRKSETDLRQLREQITKLTEEVQVHQAATTRATREKTETMDTLQGVNYELTQMRVESNFNSETVQMAYKLLSSFLFKLVPVEDERNIVVPSKPQLLGRGANGSVYAGTWRGQPVAIKRDMVISTALQSQTEAQKSAVAMVIIKECAILATLDSPYIVKFHALTLDEERFPQQLIMEKLCPLRGRLSGTEVIRLGSNISAGLVFMHGHNPQILHRDIKPLNFLYDEVNRVYKISDLGEARLLRSHSQSIATLGIGTILYQAPEMRVVGAAQTSAVDIFSFGMSVIELALFRASALKAQATESEREDDRRGRVLLVRQQRVDLSRWLDEMTAGEAGSRPDAAACKTFFDGLLGSSTR